MKDAFFIDDSGSKDWDIPYAQDFVDRPPSHNDKNRRFWGMNYFVLAGVYVDSETISKLNPLINEKKREVFGTKHIEIHSSDIRNPEKRRKKYIEKYNITESDLWHFINEFWYPLISGNTQMKIQAVVLDKRCFPLREDHSPLVIATQALFDLIEIGPNRESRIIFDQMDDAIKSEKRSQGDILKVAKHEIYLWEYFDGYSHISLDFEKSKDSNFLQIADSVAYNIYRQFVDYGDKWDASDTIEDMYPYFKMICNNFYCTESQKPPKCVGLTKLSTKA